MHTFKGHAGGASCVLDHLQGLVADRLRSAPGRRRPGPVRRMVVAADVESTGAPYVDWTDRRHAQ